MGFVCGPRRVVRTIAEQIDRVYEDGDYVGLDREGALDLLRDLGAVAWRWIVGLPHE